jgi:hypothetical protein
MDATLRFEARDLKPYREYVKSSDLRVGDAYFLVHFLDEAMHIPTLQSVVFIGSNLESSDSDHVYFQDFGSYNEGIRYGDEQPWNNVEPGDNAPPFSNANFYVIEANSPFALTYESALDVLLACSIRRKSVAMRQPNR